MLLILFRFCTTISYFVVTKDDQAVAKGEDDEEVMLEELFTAVAVATEGGRCISEMFKVLPSKAVRFTFYTIKIWVAMKPAL